jgi:hypothetical protein
MASIRTRVIACRLAKHYTRVNSKMTKDWSKFSVGSPSKRQNWTNQSCVPFDSVFHVTHIKNSLTILHDRKIKAGLIFDKSILNLERILVSWLSPNVWGDGYRYGNIRIKFDFNKIIEDKKFYWVESIAYGVPACRILLTDQEHNNLSPYDPSFNDGPWWFDSSSEIHYYNNNYCIEFLVIGIGLLITEEPSHTTRHTDHVPRRFG